MKPMIRLLVPALLASYLSCGSSHATPIVWAGPAGGYWHVPGNWSPQQVPGNGDTAAIPAGGASVVIGSAMAVSGLSVGSGSSLTIAGGMSLNGQLTNAGTIHWLDGEINVIDCDITNQSGGVFDIQCDQAMGNNGVAAQFHNAGTLRKSAGTLGTEINVLLDNTGTVEAQLGPLRFTGGGKLRGTFDADADAAIYFESGGFEFLGTQHFQGTGPVGVNGSPVVTGTLTGTCGIYGGSLESGTALTIGSSGTLNILSSITLYGSLTNSGTLNITSGMDLKGPLINSGTFNWQGGELHVFDNSGFGWSGGITNQSGGLFDIRCDQAVTNGEGAPQFHNAGTLRKSVGTGTTRIEAVFDNSGTLQAQTGTLQFAGSVAQHSGTTLTGGSWNLSNNAIVDFTQGDPITINQATVTLDGSACGFAKFTSALAANQGSLTLSNGHVLALPGPLTNSGTLRVEGTATALTVNGTYWQTAGSTTVMTGAVLVATKFVQSGGTLTGTVTVPPPVVLSNVTVTPAGPTTKARISATVSGGTPGASATMQASSDLGLTDPWEDLATLLLDGSGSAHFTLVEDPNSIGLARDFFRVSSPVD